ncbi:MULTISPECIES: cupredoxin family copper-binding protein [unclassified Ensifer]|uniref:cupredoxin domain-containing protein n=1 Tax=unclassified Ensifer TaxID=2633371 RepID=UPI000812FE6A|nr:MULTISPECIES: cupredoxin family copper-binding protein [unclassified Ensifer]OCP18275.1 amicyanin [Ensifer sp. LC54]OCP27552.1 amicyanin [Ensifer sp. LC384]OCP35222.1 amicyanin [Ensifer sp. LC163]
MRSRFYLIAIAGLLLGNGAVDVRAETIRVTIEKMAFVPAEIEARVGDTIEWVNRDILVHTATSNGGGEVLIPAKKTASFVVGESGQVDYYCRFHPNMKGRISVTKP